MVCKNCKRDIDDDSIFCKWCGEKQIRERRKICTWDSKKPEIILRLCFQFVLGSNV